jgi:cob(I)alamin adenosyltransferase
MSAELAPAERVRRCEQVMSHAWMIRTFIKHCEEVEEFPELMEVARAIFDLSRALEVKEPDPEAYLRILRKKLSKLRPAVEQFAQDAPRASTHTNFVQAVVSARACVEELERLAQTPAP